MTKPKSNQDLLWGCAPSPVGWMRLAWLNTTPLRLCHVQFCEQQDRMLNNTAHNAQAQRWVQQMFGLDDQPQSKSIALHLAGTAFQQSVWRTLAATPWGRTLSYQDLAVRCGHPKAARAVGQAMARNPLAVLVPCHRVLNKNGSLGNYHWGVEREAALLAWEQNHPQPALALDFKL